MKLWKKVALIVLTLALLLPVLEAQAATAVNPGKVVEDVIRQPTCTEPGLKIVFTNDFPNGKRQEMSALGHDWGPWTVTKQATCTAAGSRKHTCKRCQTTETVSIPAAGHKWGGWTVTKQATCGEDGSREHKCTVCGAKGTQRLAATGKHTYGPAVITKQATESAAGIKTFTCTVCGHKESKKYYMTGTISRGSVGRAEEIKVIQQELKDTGIYDGKVNGEYDKETEDAVKEFQRRAGVDEDGVMHPMVQDRLNWYWQRKKKVDPALKELISGGIRIPIKPMTTPWTSNGDGTHSRKVFFWNKPAKVETEDCAFTQRNLDNGLMRLTCPKCGAEEPELVLWTVSLGQIPDENEQLFSTTQIYGAVRYTGASGNESVRATLCRVDDEGETKVFETDDFSVYGVIDIEGPGTYVLEAQIIDGDKETEPVRSAPLQVRHQRYFFRELVLDEVHLYQTAVFPEGDVSVDLMSEVTYYHGRGPVTMSAMLYEVRGDEERLCYFMPTLLPCDTLRTYPGFDEEALPTGYVLEVTATDGFTTVTKRSNIVTYNGPKEEGRLVKAATLTVNDPEVRDDNDFLDYVKLFTCNIELEDGVQAVFMKGTLQKVGSGRCMSFLPNAGDNFVYANSGIDGPGDYYVDIVAFDGENSQLVHSNVVHVYRSDLPELTAYPYLETYNDEIYSYCAFCGGQTGDAWVTEHTVTKVSPDGATETVSVPLNTWEDEPLPFSGPGTYTASCTVTDGVSTVSAISDPLVIPNLPKSGAIIEQVIFSVSEGTSPIWHVGGAGPIVCQDAFCTVVPTAEYAELHAQGQISYQCELLSSDGQVLKTYPGVPGPVSLFVEGNGEGLYFMKVTAYCGDVVETVCSNVLNMAGSELAPLQIVGVSLYGENNQIMADVQWMGGWARIEDVKGTIVLERLKGGKAEQVATVEMTDLKNRNVWAFDVTEEGSYQATVTMSDLLSTETAQSNAIGLPGAQNVLTVKNVYLLWNEDYTTAKASFELAGPKEMVESATVTGQVLVVYQGKAPEAIDLGAYGPGWNSVDLGDGQLTYILEVIAEYTLPDGTTDTAYGFSLVPLQGLPYGA